MTAKPGMRSSPTQLANLRPPWNSENAPHSKGRPKGVTYVSEHLRGSLAGLTRAELQAIAGDENEPQERRSAALLKLDALDPTLKPKDRREALAEQMDRETGRPTQVTSVQIESPDPRAVLAELRTEIEKRRESKQLSDG